LLIRCPTASFAFPPQIYVCPSRTFELADVCAVLTTLRTAIRF